MPKLKELNDENLKDLINLSDFKKCLKEMDADKRAWAYLKLMEFVIPKKQSVQQDINTNVKDDAEKMVARLANSFSN